MLWLCLQHTAFILESQDNFGPKVLIGSLTFSSDPVQEMGIGSRNSLTDILTGKEFAVSTVWEDAKGGAIMQPITGQYECVHSSGMGLDYFTSRIDRLILHSDGRFILTVQQRSRVTHAAHSLMSGGQVSAIAPETRLEGFYVCQDRVISLRFDNGGLEEAQISPNGDGLQIGPNFFTKVSDSTLLPPTHRLKQDMEDIAKGIKIARTIGGIAAKAAKTIQGTFQPTQEPEIEQTTPQAPSLIQQNQPGQGSAPPTSPQNVTSGSQSTPQQTPSMGAVLYCDQCGAPYRPDKRFCGNCGNRLA